MPGAGDLIEKVEVQEESRTSNGQGGYTTVWTKLSARGDARAQIIGLSGDEAISAGVQRSVQQWRVVIRRRADVSTKNRLIWGALTLDIKSAMPLPADPRAFTLLICESGAVG